MITATYNGRAPDNAGKLEAAILANRFAGKQVPDLQYAVLGCGNTQWRETYQAFPKLVDTILAAAGAHAVVPRGEADADRDFDGAVDAWLKQLWSALGDATEVAAPALRAIIQNDTQIRARAMPEAAVALEVLRNDELVRDPTGLWDHAREAPRASTRHIVLRLPETMRYATGDHIAIYARNRPALVQAVLRRIWPRAGCRAGAARPGRPPAPFANRHARHRPPIAERFRGAAGPRHAPRRACPARRRRFPRHPCSPERAGAGYRGSPRRLPNPNRRPARQRPSICYRNIQISPWAWKACSISAPPSGHASTRSRPHP